MIVEIALSIIWMVILIGVPTSGGGVKGEVAERCWMPTECTLQQVPKWRLVNPIAFSWSFFLCSGPASHRAPVNADIMMTSALGLIDLIPAVS